MMSLKTGGAPSQARTQTRLDDTGLLSKIYHTVITPVNFITFLISLYIVDNRYRAQREHHHGRDNHNYNDDSNRRRPWLHRVLYYRRAAAVPSSVDHQSLTTTSTTATATATGKAVTTVHISSGCDADTATATATATATVTTRTRTRSGSNNSVDDEHDDGTWYYHSKQKKLFMMEAADAFALRGWAVVGLFTVVFTAGWLLVRLGLWIGWALLKRIW